MPRVRKRKDIPHCQKCGCNTFTQEVKETLLIEFDDEGDAEIVDTEETFRSEYSCFDCEAKFNRNNMRG